MKLRIDAHQHFWRYDPAEYGWIDDRMAALRRDFLPDESRREMTGAGFDACVAVQARQTDRETDWLLALADAHPFIVGVVGVVRAAGAAEAGSSSSSGVPSSLPPRWRRQNWRSLPCRFNSTTFEHPGLAQAERSTAVTLICRASSSSSLPRGSRPRRPPVLAAQPRPGLCRPCPAIPTGIRL